jgi:ribokinase
MGRIVVLGSLNVDLVATLPHLPRPGETVLGDQIRTFSGGKGANQAVAVARLGGDVALIGRVGTDAFGRGLLDDLARDRVDVGGVALDPESPTGAALIMVEIGGQNLIAVAPGANLAVSQSDVSRAIEALGQDGVLLLQLEIPVGMVELAIVQASERGARVLLNPAPAAKLDPSILDRIDVLVMNELEAASLFGKPVVDLRTAGHVTKEATSAGVKMAVVTLGAAGAIFSDRGGPEHVPGFAVQAVDATAAGDAFMGALAVALDADVGHRRAIELANAAGAVAASRPGAQSSLPNARDLQQLLGLHWPAPDPGRKRGPRAPDNPPSGIETA